MLDIRQALKKSESKKDRMGGGNNIFLKISISLPPFRLLTDRLLFIMTLHDFPFHCFKRSHCYTGGELCSQHCYEMTRTHTYIHTYTLMRKNGAIMIVHRVLFVYFFFDIQSALEANKFAVSYYFPFSLLPTFSGSRFTP